MSTPNAKRLAKRVKLSEEHLITRMLNIAEGLEDVIKLGRGDPDLDTPPHIVAAGQKALAEGATHYTHPLGILPLREAIAEQIRTYGGADYAVDEIMVTPGGQHGMFVIALALLNAGDEIIVPCPGYNPYGQAAELSDAKVVKVPMGMETNFTLTAEMIEPHITERSKILVLINPNNPTGTVTAPDEVRKIAALAEKHDLIVISDEIYARLTFGNHTVQSVAALPGMKERTITLSGFSKAYAMTGWRIGYLAGPRDLITPMSEINHAFAISTAAVSQHAALAAASGPQECVEEMRATYDARRQAICAGLDRIGMSYAEPQGGFYVYADVSSLGLGITAGTFCERLLAEGKVMMYPGTIYGDHTDDFVRMSMTQPVERINEAMARMASVVETIRAESHEAAL
ncbi:aspartate aminotransferase/aminotransferase [Pseudooceanicola antarcticus]|uniref:Aminotransferase n=1 Tax=Pseudooceanicola antarcticus TaxID=1247613 RepID=A0A285HLF2_9RHOB|nr:pyridoxal phosphate-dependent aminotransferase [Pseudooceanicola antarcticus]PJE27968.1 pyridoxal phosphate-dependent aminotransferase [Pseudooceanicola antarcticus]SNY35596.1 aspartate aminotransferase/aminotransferase [Pseudooceanicola antarcticus]